ncbi:MAG: hypothetical protein NXY57DRAFT_967925 [Lentinula lateritia]|nr:MAG: hypothetical protein NXY57DRAFT_967925 [Lentinula lateritia]
MINQIILRFATLLQSLSEILVNDTWLSSQDFCTGLIATGLNAEEANDLLDPADKQNEPKAVRLLQNLSSLHELPSPIHPEEQKRHMAINFISDALNFFLQPFINVTMDLEAQCLSLATYAHLMAAMFFRGHLSFLTSALYADSHAIVGNYRMGDVNIPKLWVQAADVANAILVDVFGPFAFMNFESQFSSPNCDFLRPTSSRYVGSSFEDDEASHFDQSVEEEEGNLA